MKVTFIGLGIMGSRMAANLLKNGIDLTVWNRTKEPVEALQTQGAKTAATAPEAVKEADVVFTMLATPEAVEAVALGQDGFLSSMKNNAIWVDSSTVNPSFSRQLDEAAHAHGVRFLDAPVTGTKPQAANAELTFFVGGDDKDFEEVRPLMDIMSIKTLHLGAKGMGASFKMLLNAMLAQSMIVFSEAVLLGQKMGFSKDFLLDTLSNSVVAAPFTKNKVGMMKTDDYDVQFPLELMQKDLHLFTLTAYENGQPAYLANIAKEVFASAKKSGLGREDFAAVHRFLEGQG